MKALKDVEGYVKEIQDAIDWKYVDSIRNNVEKRIELYNKKYDAFWQYVKELIGGL